MGLVLQEMKKNASAIKSEDENQSTLTSPSGHRFWKALIQELSRMSEESTDEIVKDLAGEYLEELFEALSPSIPVLIPTKGVFVILALAECSQGRFKDQIKQCLGDLGIMAKGTPTKKGKLEQTPGVKLLMTALSSSE